MRMPDAAPVQVLGFSPNFFLISRQIYFYLLRKGGKINEKIAVVSHPILACFLEYIEGEMASAFKVVSINYYISFRSSGSPLSLIIGR